MDPISFTDDRAFEHLRDEGYVYTYRTSLRAEPVGPCWVNRGRGETKEFDGKIQPVREGVEPHEFVLNPFADESGFGSVEEWREAIFELNEHIPNSGYIYKVVRMDPATDDRGQ